MFVMKVLVAYKMTGKWIVLLVLGVVTARPKVLDVPLQSGGSGTICGNLTCSYCCLEGYVCATYLPDCAYISTDNYTENIIFIVFASLFGVWVAIWLCATVCRFIQNRRKLNVK